jgi:spore coat polysaccharide biosynthesis protein SpsF
MGSTRLPGKSMLDLAGAPLVARVLERVARCREVDEVVLATTERDDDDVLAALAEQYGAAVFRGAEDDLVDRYVRAARAHGASIIVRLPADNPVPEPREIDRIVSYHRSSANAFSSNLAQVFGNGYPDGIGAEVIDADALEEVWRTERDPRRREHPHLSFFDYDAQQPTDARFPVGTVECPPELRRPDLVLDVNTAEQYEFMRELYEYLHPLDPEFSVVDVIRWYDDVYRHARP